MNWLRSILARILNLHPATEWSSSRSHIRYGYDDAKKDLTSSDRKELQRLSRFFEAGSAIVNRMADLWECYVVGTGLQIFPASSSDEWNKKAQARWDEWKRFADIASRDSWDICQSRLARSWFVDGEVFILLTREGQFPRVQMIEAHRCQSPENPPASVVDGVDLDANGRPVAYWFKTGEKTLTRFEASFVIHLFEPQRIGQVRGIPLISPVLNDIRDLDDLQILEMRASKLAATIGIVQKNKAGELPVSERLRTKFSVSNTSPTGATATQNRADYYESSIGGDIKVLQSGDELQQFLNNRPTESMRALWRNISEKICVGTGFVHAVVFPDSMQGTVYRGALDMMNVFFRARSAVAANAFQRVYEWVIGNDTTLIQGRPADWRKTSVRPPRGVNVDVGRNSTAAINELAAGMKNYQGYYAELGMDWQQELEQKAKEAAFIAQLALKYTVAPEQIAASSLPSGDAAQPQPTDDL